MVPEALCDGGSDPEDLGDVLSSDQHVSVVQLNVHIRLFVQQVVCAAGWSQADQLPEVTVQLVATGCLGEGDRDALKTVFHIHTAVLLHVHVTLVEDVWFRRFKINRNR